MDKKETPKFVEGSTMKHVVVMSLTTSIGLMAIFLVDLIDMFFLSLLGEAELAAAIGFAGTIIFFTTSIGIGLSITMSALVSKSLGSKKKMRASSYMMNIYFLSLIISIPITVLIWLFIPQLLMLIGAEGKTLDLATSYLKILIPSFPILGLAMASGAVLRALGDAKKAMYSTLGGAFVNLVLDPIFIFAMSMGIEGAALASFMARISILIIALYPIHFQYNMFSRIDFNLFISDLKDIFSIAGPAMLTNLATPIGNAYVIYQISQFGESAVAGMSVIGRLLPVAFAVVFATSGAIGPIIGQNYGALNFNRVRSTLKDSIKFIFIYVVFISVILFLLADTISNIFKLSGEARELVIIFCQYVAITFFLNGILFISNASFNNLGKAKLSTIFNFLKATIFTIPFCYFGAIYFGAPGVIIGQAIGASIIGVISLFFAFRVVSEVERKNLNL